jgi:hypothetical protein
VTIETQLAGGYTALPAGMLASIVINLGMRAQPGLRLLHGGSGGFALAPLPRDDLTAYRAL